MIIKKVPDSIAIREARKAAKLTQKELAEKVSLRRETIIRLEKGYKWAIGFRTIQKIADACNVSRDSLLVEISEEHIEKSPAEIPNFRLHLHVSLRDEYEAMLLDLWRKLPRETRVRALSIIQRLAGRMTAH